MSAWNYNGSQVSDRCPFGYLFKKWYVDILTHENWCELLDYINIVGNLRDEKIQLEMTVGGTSC